MPASADPPTLRGEHVTLRPLTTADREVLNRVWILRKLLTQLNTVEAMDFLHDKIKGTTMNQEFLDSMSQ